MQSGGHQGFPRDSQPKLSRGLKNLRTTLGACSFQIKHREMVTCYFLHFCGINSSPKKNLHWKPKSGWDAWTKAMSPAEPEAHPTPGLGWHLATCIHALKGCQKPLNYRHQDPQDTQTHGSPCAYGAVSPGAWASVSATDLPMLPIASSVLLGDP